MHASQYFLRVWNIAEEQGACLFIMPALCNAKEVKPTHALPSALQACKGLLLLDKHGPSERVAAPIY